VFAAQIFIAKLLFTTFGLITTGSGTLSHVQHTVVVLVSVQGCAKWGPPILVYTLSNIYEIFLMIVILL